MRGPQSALYGSNAIGAVVRDRHPRGGAGPRRASLEGGGFGTDADGRELLGTAGGWFVGCRRRSAASDGFNGQQTASGRRRRERRLRAYRGRAAAAAGATTPVVRSAATCATRPTSAASPARSASIPIGELHGDRSGVARRATIDGARPLGGDVSRSASTRAHARRRSRGTRSRASSPARSARPTSGRAASTARGQTDITLGPGLDLSAGARAPARTRGQHLHHRQHGRDSDRARASPAISARPVEPAERLFVTAGVRLEDIHRDAIEALDIRSVRRPPMPADDVVSLNPQMSAAWLCVKRRRADYTKLRGAAGTGIRPPDGFELAFTDNPSLKPERSRSVEAGIDQAFAGGTRPRRSHVLPEHYDDLIVAVGLVRGSSRYRTDNISNARARGLELATTVAARVPAGIDLQARVSYTFLDSEILAVDRRRRRAAAVHRRPAAAAPAAASVVDRRERRRVDARPRGLDGGGRGRVLDVEPSFGTFGGLFDATGYKVWNAGASWRVVAPIEVFGRIENLFDRDYEEAFGFPALGAARDGRAAHCCRPMTSRSAIGRRAGASAACRWTLPADGFVGILGPNGSGKTTLLRLLAGTRGRRAGRVLLDGTAISPRSAAATDRPTDGGGPAGNAPRVRLHACSKWC